MLPLFYVVVIVINQVAQKHLLPDNKDNGYVFITVGDLQNSCGVDFQS